MASKQPTRPGDGWFTKPEISAVFDVGPGTFDRDYRRYATASATKTVDGKLFFHARRIIEAWSRQQRGQVDSDPLLAGGDSPELERIRAAEADIREAKRDEVYGRKLEIADIEPPLQELAGMVRRLGDALGRRYGNDAINSVNEVADRFEQFAAEFFAERRRGTADVEPGLGEAADPEPADDAGVRRAGNRDSDRAVRRD